MALMTPSVIDFLLNYRNLEKKTVFKVGSVCSKGICFFRKLLKPAKNSIIGQ